MSPSRKYLRNADQEGNPFRTETDDRVSMLSSHTTADTPYLETSESNRHHNGPTSPHVPVCDPIPPSSYWKTTQKGVSSDAVELLPLPDQNCSSGFQAGEKRHPEEWKPLMLRLGPGILMVLVCWILAILLQIFDIIARRRQGFSTDNHNSIQLARYLPTVAVIGLGFAWKSLVQDLKVVLPFSEMSNKWSDPKKSVLLDYIEPLEFKSVYKSATNRHWAMFLGLLVGLLSGILVPLANSLTFITLYSPVTQEASMNKLSQFSFQGALSDNNGTLTIPWDYRGNAPYAAVASSRQPNGQSSPWTIDSFAFESLDLTPWSQKNSTVAATVQAFYSTLDCSTINYGLSNSTGSWRLRPNDDSLVSVKCESAFELNIYTTSTRDMAWLNVTDCSDKGTDLRMLATVMTDAPHSFMKTAPNTTAVGLLCTPHYFTREIDIQVNGSTGSIMGFQQTVQAPKAIDINTTLPVVYTYLNFPLDETSQHAYVQDYAGPTESTRVPQATFMNVTAYASDYISKQGRDPFGDQLFVNSRKASDYVSDPALLRSEITSLANTILTQLVNSFARSNVSLPLKGSVTLHESRLHVRQGSLRAMQAILAFMGVVCILCCSVLRPRTRLTEDPSNLAAASIILSASESAIEKRLQHDAVSDIDTSMVSLSKTRWLLSYSEKGKTVIEADAINEYSNRPYDQPIDHSVTLSRDSTPEGYEPYPFRFSSMVGLAFVLCAIIITLAVLLKFSLAVDGFIILNSTQSAAWSLVPTTILVLLGYGLSSVHGVLQALTPYLALRKPRGSNTLRSSTNTSILFMPVQALLQFGSVALALTSIGTLMFPAVKVLAAGLYVPTGSISVHPVDITLDTSMPDRLEAMYDLFNASADTAVVDSMVKQASEFTEWTSIPSFRTPRRAGVLGNLVFANLTSLSSNYTQASGLGGTISVRVPAISVNVTCSSLAPEDFGTRVSDSTPSNANYTSFQFTQDCTTKLCNDTFTDFQVGFGGAGPITWSRSNYSKVMDTRYKGMASVGGLIKLGGLSSFNTSYILTMGEFPSVGENFVNLTQIGDDTVPLTPGMFNMSTTPMMVAAVCNKQLFEVEVDVELTRSVKTGVDGTTILPWSIASYNQTSITYKRQYRNETPAWVYPKQTIRSQYNSDTDSLINGDSLWPNPGKSTNVYELLAAHQEFQNGNLTGLLNHVQLAKAVQQVWTSYALEMLTELRPHALEGASPASTKVVSGIVTTSTTRMKQNRDITIALCALLFVILLGLIYTFISFPRESLMAKPPTSIAAQMSLLAGSELVRQLRTDGVRSTSEATIWGEKFRLGWWAVGSNIGGAGQAWRWGIDVLGNEKKDHDTTYHGSL